MAQPLEAKMRLEMLPDESKLGWPTVYAAVTENNEVIWAYDNGDKVRPSSRESYFAEATIGEDRSLFKVSKRGKIVIVEACGWYDSDFHFKFEVTIREPYKAVILAHELAGLMDAAHEG